MTAQTNQKAYSYIRFSTPEQARGDSYRRQREAAEKYCALNGFELVSSSEYLFFDKGRSAYKGKHLDDTGELARFLSYVKNGTIAPGSLLIVESLDRLSRERVRDALPRFLDILGQGINIYTSSDSKLYTKDYNEVDLIVSIVNMSRAHNESSIKGERVSKAWRQKQNAARDSKRPLGKACPYWLELVDGVYQPIPERVAVVKEIFCLSINGYGQAAIAKQLNARNIPVFGSGSRNKSGAWGSSSTGKILANRAVLGEYQPTGLVSGKRVRLGEPVENMFPVVISRSDFDEAQVMRSTRRLSKSTKTAKNFNVWQGLAKCAICAESMHLVNKGDPPKSGKYLRCYGYAKGRCSNKAIRLELSEGAFKEILSKVDSLSLIQDSQAQIRKEISRIDLRLMAISKRQAEIEIQLLELDTSLPDSTLVVLSKLEQEAKDLKIRREKLNLDSRREKIVNKADFIERLDLVSYEGRAKANHLLKALGVKVKVERRQEHVFYAVEVEDRLNFVLKHGEQFNDYYPYTAELTDILRSQGDDSAFQQMHADMVRNVFSLLDKISENERLMKAIAHSPVIPIKI